MYKNILIAALASISIAQGMQSNPQTLEDITAKTFVASLADNPQSYLTQYSSNKKLPSGLQKSIITKFIQLKPQVITNLAACKLKNDGKFLPKKEGLFQVLSPDGCYRLSVNFYNSPNLGLSATSSLDDFTNNRSFFIDAEQVFFIDSDSDETDTESDDSDCESEYECGNNGEISPVYFSPDSLSCVIISYNRFGFWDIEKLKQDEDYQPTVITIPEEIRGFKNLFVHSVANDGSWVLTENNYLASDGLYTRLARWDLVNKKCIEFDFNILTHCLVNPNGKQVLIFGQDNRPFVDFNYVDLWDIAQTNILYSFPHSSNAKIKPLFSNNGLYLLTSSANGQCKIYNTQTGEVVIGDNTASADALFSPDSSLLTLRKADYIAVYDLATGRQKYQFYCPQDIQSLKFSSDSSLLAYSCRNGDRIELYRMHTGEPMQSLDHAGVSIFEFSPDGTHMVSYGFRLIHHSVRAIRHELKLWNIRSGTCSMILDLSDMYNNVVFSGNINFSPDGKQIFITHEWAHNPSYVWDLGLYLAYFNNALSLDQIALLALLHNANKRHLGQSMSVDSLAGAFDVDKQAEAKRVITQIMQTFDSRAAQAVARAYNLKE